MNPAAVNDPSWSRRKWAGMVGLIVVLQGAFVILVSDRTQIPASDNRQKLLATIIADPQSNQKLVDVLGIGDPSLLALINPQPFTSGRPKFKEPEEPAPWDLIEPDRPLAHSPEGLGATFNAFMRTNVAFPLLADSKPRPEPMRIAPPASILDGVTQLQLGEGLADRQLKGPLPSLPAWTNLDLVTNTIVQVTVSPEGDVFSPRLASGAATTPIQHQADLAAIAIARSLRFQARPPADGTNVSLFTRGNVIFQWHTVEPRSGSNSRAP